jgi:xeroderma pigmentosum group C-complementing protein
MFEAAITNLAEWWSTTFFDVTFDGHLRNRTYDEVKTKLVAAGLLSQDKDSVMDLEALQDALNNDGEVIRSSKSLMKHALMQSGSRDTSAQLFTALCRALGIPARLVVSLQSMPWQTGVGRPRPTYDRTKRKRKRKGKGKEEQEAENGEGDEEEDEDDFEEVEIPEPVATSASGSDAKGKGKEKAFTSVGQRLDGKPIPKSEKAKGKEKAKPVINLRKTKSKGNILGSSLEPSSAGSSRLGKMLPIPTSSSCSSYILATPDPVTTPPVFWTEVFSRPDARWLPVDPIRCIVNKRKIFDPTPTTHSAPATQPGSTIFPRPYASAAPSKRNVGSSTKQENRMVYVLAFEEDGYARDVTRRYAKEYSAKTAKIQGGSRTGTRRQAWWEQVVGTLSRPYRLVCSISPFGVVVWIDDIMSSIEMTLKMKSSKLHR